MNYLIQASMPKDKSRSIADTVKKYGAQLLGFVKSKVKLLEDAEDVLQDVWYQFSNLPEPEELESVSGWLYQVARNKITDRYRKKKEDLIDDYLYENEEGEFNFRDLLLAEDSNDPELAFFKETFWKTFQSAIDELPENQKTVFIQNELEDKTLQEIADAENVPLKTIISRKGYAVKHLRKKLAFLHEEMNK